MSIISTLQTGMKILVKGSEKIGTSKKTFVKKKSWKRVKNKWMKNFYRSKLYNNLVSKILIFKDATFNEIES